MKEYQKAFGLATRTATSTKTLVTKSIGGLFFINCTALTGTPSVVFTFKGEDPITSTEYTIIESLPVTNVGLQVLRVHPSLTTTTGELVANGDFADWTGDDPDDWVVTEVGDATSNIVENSGACRIISDGTTTKIVKSGHLTKGRRYRITLDISSVTGGLTLSDGGANQKTWESTGEKSFDWTAKGAQIILQRSGACDVTFDNVSVKEHPVSKDTLPQSITVTATHADTDSITYSVGFIGVG